MEKLHHENPGKISKDGVCQKKATPKIQWFIYIYTYIYNIYIYIEYFIMFILVYSMLVYWFRKSFIA